MESSRNSRRNSKAIEADWTWLGLVGQGSGCHRCNAPIARVDGEVARPVGRGVTRNKYLMALRPAVVARTLEDVCTATVGAFASSREAVLAFLGDSNAGETRRRFAEGMLILLVDTCPFSPLPDHLPPPAQRLLRFNLTPLQAVGGTASHGISRRAMFRLRRLGGDVNSSSSRISLVFSFLIISGVSACSDGNIHAPADSGPLDACFHRVSNSSRCGTSFARLNANPRSAVGKDVVLVGYLAVRNGLPVLFPSEDDYSNDVVFNAVELRGAGSEVLDGKWYRMVIVQARFSLSEGPQEPWLGVMSGVSKVDAMLPVEREDPAALRVHIDSIRDRSGK